MTGKMPEKPFPVCVAVLKKITEADLFEFVEPETVDVLPVLMRNTEPLHLWSPVLSANKNVT
jgi:hypothetical protein